MRGHRERSGCGVVCFGMTRAGIAVPLACSDAVIKVRAKLHKLLDTNALNAQLAEKMTKFIDEDPKLTKEKKRLLKNATKEIKAKVKKYTNIFERTKSCITAKASARASQLGTTLPLARLLPPWVAWC